MAGSSIDLMSIFQAASSVFSQNKTELNQADTYNHDHGDNISQVFKLITQAVGQKSSASPSEQLNYASQVLQQKATSGSSQLYSQALQTAASQLQGQSNISADNIMPLLQSLLGGGQQPSPNALAGSGSGDLLGGLLFTLDGSGTQKSGVVSNWMISSAEGWHSCRRNNPVAEGCKGSWMPLSQAVLWENHLPALNRRSSLLIRFW